MKSGIYLITCTPPGGLPRYYVGQSVDVARRLLEHFGELRRGDHCNPYMQAAFNKYGHSCFSGEVLEHAAAGVLSEMEQFWLDEMAGCPRCFNIAVCADNPARGLKRSAETIEKMRAAKTGLVHSPETRARISQVQRNKKRGPRAAETARKIGDAQLGAKNHMFGKSGHLSARSKPVAGVNIKTGDEIGFASANLARSSGFQPTGITAVCRGEARQYKGFVWRFTGQKSSS